MAWTHLLKSAPFFSSNIGVKIPYKIRKCYFFKCIFQAEKNIFFKKKVHLIEKCSGTQNTVCQKYFFAV